MVKMVKVIACFLLGFLFVMHGLGDFTAHAKHQGKGMQLVTGKYYLLPDQKEPSNEILRRNIGIGGSRKMMSRQHSQVDEETRRLLEAQREIVNLIHKDYRGGSAGNSMGRRKPPVHNDVPRH